MEKNSFTLEALSGRSMKELVEIAADMDIPYRLEFPKPQLMSMILRREEVLRNTVIPRRPSKLAPYET